MEYVNAKPGTLLSLVEETLTSEQGSQWLWGGLEPGYLNTAETE